MTPADATRTLRALRRWRTSEDLAAVLDVSKATARRYAKALFRARRVECGFVRQGSRGPRAVRWRAR